MYLFCLAILFAPNKVHGRKPEGDVVGLKVDRKTTTHTHRERERKREKHTNTHTHTHT